MPRWQRFPRPRAKVADLELDRGEVRLPTPIVEVDPAGAHTEVGQLGSALNRMLDRIAGALSARHASETRVRQFVADASHELRTPLAAIRGYTELAQRKRSDVPDDVAHAMSRVESETERMTHLVEDMLLLARLDTGRPLEREQVDLSRLVVDAVSDCPHRRTRPPSGLSTCPMSPSSSPATRRACIRCWPICSPTRAPTRRRARRSPLSLAAPTDAGAVLTVADDGPGIPEYLQPEIFERFARGDSSRSRRGGSTGLGLAIVAAVVKAHRGTIEVHSAKGRTVFSVMFPGDTQASHSAAQSGA